MATTRRVKTWDDVMRTVDQYAQKKVASMSDKARKSVRDGALNEEAERVLKRACRKPPKDVAFGLLYQGMKAKFDEVVRKSAALEGW
ncbi:MAG TPA: hypothetical protein VKM54_13050 [Myxococcota bacterium]|jgi:hypothetical protein|nr:hypothetical protein [Myxococcota bacterium]